jgi:hypothetical protein
MFVTFRREKPIDPMMTPRSTIPSPPQIPSTPKVETRFKQYRLECTLVKVDPKGKDLGHDGKGKVLSIPSFVLREGQEYKTLCGGQQPVFGDKDNELEFLDFGVSTRFKVTGLKDGIVRLEAELEEIDIEPVGMNEFQAHGRTVRVIKRLKLGESVKLVEKDDRGEPRHWLRIKVVKEEMVDLERAYSAPVIQRK